MPAKRKSISALVQKNAHKKESVESDVVLETKSKSEAENMNSSVLSNTETSTKKAKTAEIVNHEGGVKFKDIMVVKRSDEVQSRFNAMADYLLNHSILLCGSKMYRLVEIEFYMVADFHQDCYAHKAPEQKQNLIWYFHRTVPGIDLTFGGGDVQFGGVLLRSVEDLSDGSLIEGTANILGLACRNNGCSSKEELMPLLAPGLAAVDDDLKVEEIKLLQDAQTTGSRTLPQKAKVQLTLIHDHGLANKTVYSCPRVSLGVKKDPGLLKHHMLMAHYRFLTDLRNIKSGKPNIALALLKSLGWSEKTVSDATGCKLATVTKYKELLSKPYTRKMDRFPPCRSLLLEDYCELYYLVCKNYEIPVRHK